MNYNIFVVKMIFFVANKILYVDICVMIMLGFTQIFNRLLYLYRPIFHNKVYKTS